MEDKKTLVVKYDEHDNEKIRKSMRMWHVIHTEYGGYTENEVTISIYEDGTLTFWDDYSYFYPDMAMKLIEFLNENYYDKKAIRDD